MTSNHPFDLVIGLDRSDRKADLYLIHTASGKTERQTIRTSPEALHDWLLQLRQKHPNARVAICLEQPATSLILFFEAYLWITLYAINPITLQKFREAFVTSRAKDDGKDAQYQAELLLTHHHKLKPWQPDDSQTRQLQQLVSHRRAVVDERTGLTNRLEALLKQYFPQALPLCGEDSLASTGHRLTAQMADLGEPAEGPHRIAPTVLLPPRFPQPEVDPTAP